MTEQYDPYENAIAERINGILKQEFNVDMPKLDLDTRKQLVKDSIEIYNELRPHWSNSLMTPNQMHQQNQQEIKIYKKQKAMT
jgi:transposase InsO family protein